MSSNRILSIVISFCVLILLGISIWAWRNMPIYSDEIAMRVQAMRFIPDHGMSFGLYSLCADRVHAVPWIFVPSAYILSWIDLQFTSPDSRMIGMTLLCVSLALMVWHSAASRNPAATLWIPASVIGVAGSSLVFFRFESFFFLHIGLCALALLSRSWQRIWQIGVGLLLIFNQLTMAYVHPQALLFIPLTAYLSYRLMAGTGFKPVMLTAFAAGNGIIAWMTMDFFAQTCKAHPGIEVHWKKMITQESDITAHGLWNLLAERANIFANMFYYKTTYEVNYLPAIPASPLALSADILNGWILVALCFLAAAGLFLAGLAALCALRAWAARRFEITSFDHSIVYALIFFPSLMLFMYDATTHFYRCFFLNFLCVMALAFELSQKEHPAFKKLTLAGGMMLWLIAAGSAVLNYEFFYKQIASHSIPSTPLTNPWVASPEKVTAFAKRCSIDLSKGNGLVDDLTYDAVKKYYRAHLITYLGLQAGLAGVTMEEALRDIKPNYAIARCSSMNGSNWSPGQKDGELCCRRF